VAYRDYQPLTQPGFLRGAYGYAWGAALGIIKDFFSDLTKQGVQQRFIGSAQSDALSAIGAERGIPQGVLESTAIYVESLINAWSEWQLSGSPWGILGLLNFLGYPDAYVLTQRGALYGPSGSVVVPNPGLGIVGVPPVVSVYSGVNLTFAIGSDSFGSQGLVYDPQVVGYTFKGYWEPGTDYTNAIVYPNPPNGIIYVQTGGNGTPSGALPPTWNPTIGQTTTDNGITWMAYGSAEGEPVGQSQGYALTDYWAAYLVVMSPIPSTWTNIQNPPTPTSSPSVFEILAIVSLLSSFNAGYAVCCGVLAPFSGSRATFCWPLNRTFHGDCGMTEPGGTGVQGEWTQLWTPHTLWTVGAQIVPTTPNGYWYRCTTGGAGGYVQPTWPTPTGTVSDGGATWTCEGPANSFLTGTGAPTNLSTVFQFSSEE
jgi:hypothetical protein